MKEEKQSCCGDDQSCSSGKESCCSHHGHGCHGKKVIIVALMVFVIIYLGVLTRNALRTYDYIGKTPDMINQITVTGTAKISATPDVAVLSIGIVSEGATVNLAQKGTTEKMNSIVNALKNDFKVEAKDIRTDNFSVNPKYDWNNGKQNIVGYTVNQFVSVKVRNFDNTGNILAKATELGANNVSGPIFSIDDPEKAKAEARTQAIAQAKEKAQVLADQVGIKLGRLVNFYEGGLETANFTSGMGGGPVSMMDSAVKVAPSIEPGTQDIQLTVNLSYEIK